MTFLIGGGGLEVKGVGTILRKDGYPAKSASVFRFSLFHDRTPKAHAIVEAPSGRPAPW